MKRFIPYGLLLCLLITGCQSVNQLGITTLRPADITIPPADRDLVVINGATEQAPGTGNFYIGLDGKKQTFRPEGGKQLPVFMETFTEGLANTGYFRFVKIYPVDSLPGPRNGSTVLSDELLSEIRRLTGAQTVLRLTGYQYEATLRDHVLPGDAYYHATLDIVTKVSFDLCRPGTEPLSFMFPDTLFWEGYGFSPDEARLQLPPYADCLNEAAAYTADEQIKRLTPYPVEENRYYFVTSNATMRDAGQYVRENRWEDASYLWEYVYEKTKKNATKAKAAANLALYYELQDKYREALPWAQQGLQLIANETGRTVSLYKWLEAYVSRLTDRIAEDEKLRPQL